MKTSFQQHRFSISLAALILLLIGSPLVDHLFRVENQFLGRLLVYFCYMMVLLSAMVSVCTRPRQLVVGYTFAGLVILSQGISVFDSRIPVVVISGLLGAGFLFYIVVMILRHLFQVTRVTMNTIFASLCAYLLLGLLWAYLYSVVFALHPDAFVFTSAEADPDLRVGAPNSTFGVYYSLVTLTTLGYGDVVPLSSMARMLASVEAVIGQIYLTVLVARLIGLHISHTAPTAGGTSSSEN